MMHRLCAGSLDVERLSQPWEMPIFLKVQELFFWMMYSAKGMNPSYGVAPIEDGL